MSGYVRLGQVRVAYVRLSLGWVGLGQIRCD